MVLALCLLANAAVFDAGVIGIRKGMRRKAQLHDQQHASKQQAQRRGWPGD